MFDSSRQRVLMGAAATMAALGLVLVGATTASARDGGPGRGGGPLDSLIKAGTITTTQAEAVKEALKGSREASRDEREQERQALLTDVLAGLVKSGTITAAQSSAIASADRRELRDLVANGTVTRESLRAVHEAMHTAIEGERGDHQAEKAANLAKVLSGLVTDGTITQAQSTAITQALAEARDAAGRGERRGAEHRDGYRHSGNRDGGSRGGR